MTVAYGVMAALALLLLLGYCVLLRKKEFWLLLLYVSVTVVNLGYFMLSLSKTLSFALFANRVAYLGSILLMICMLMTVLRLCGFSYRRWVPIVLLSLGAVMLTLVGSVPLYYREVSLEFVGGGAKLCKVYGVLHPVYLCYTLGYFTAMIVTILLALKKQLKGAPKQATLMVGVVLGNILIWFVEKLIPVDFEFLSISYLFSELVFLGLYWMMQDYVRADLVPRPVQEVPRPVPIDIATMPMEEKILKVLSFLKPGEMLAEREREVLELVLQNKKRKEIAEELCLSENTIKTYTRTLYGKVGVSSREELYALLIK